MILPISTSINRVTYRKEQSFKSSALLSNSSTHITPRYKQIDVNSVDFIKYVYSRLKAWCNGVVNVNVESGKLEDIVKSNEAYIYIFNHTSKQLRDANAAKFFNTLLYREYIYKSQGDSCPRSKVMANKNILNKTKDNGEEFKWMGFVPVTVGIFNRHKKHGRNSQILNQLSEEISNNKTSLFIFPEGILASLSFLPIRYKFQAGTSVIIKKILDLKDKISVIPIGLAHNKHESSIHIGDKITFSKEDGKYYASKGNISSQYFDKSLSSLWDDKEKIVITEQGNPVAKESIVPFISGILAQNLESCVKEAQEDLTKGDKRIYTL